MRIEQADDRARAIDDDEYCGPDMLWEIAKGIVTAMAAVIAIAVIFLLTSSAAEPSQQHQPGLVESIVPIEVTSTRQDCSVPGYCRMIRVNGRGTGTVVCADRSGSTVLTAAHVVRGAQSVTVYDRPARVLAVDDRLASGRDIALLHVPGLHGLRPIPVATTSITAGRTVRLWGFGSESERGYFDAPALSDAWVKAVAREGDSGGPVVADGAIVGVINGVSNDGQTVITPCHHVREFILRCRPECVPSPLPVAPLAAAPPPPIELPGDIPDREKVRRIESLEREVATLRKQLAESVSGKFGPPGPQGERGPQGPAGPPGKDASARPLQVRLDVVDDSGKVVASDTETYQPGQPIVLRFHERLLTKNK